MTDRPEHTLAIWSAPRSKLLALWIASGMLSAIVFSFLLGGILAVVSQETLQGTALSLLPAPIRSFVAGSLFDLALLIVVLPFGMPIFVGCLLLWLRLARRVKLLESGWLATALGLSVLSLIAASPFAIASPEPEYWYVTLLFWVGLVVPRLAVRRLRPGSFLES